MSDPISSATKPVPENLQVVREAMSVIISLVVLALAAYMLYGTFVAGSATVAVPPSFASAQDASAANAQYERVLKAQADAYARQKDVMLYVLALFGTVMGYYLGRVPAEASARRAERSAESAQKELSKSQDRLVDESGKTSTAVAEAGRAKEAKTVVEAKLRTSAAAMKEASVAMKAQTRRSGGAKGYASLSPSAEGANDEVEGLVKLTVTTRQSSGRSRSSTPRWPS